MKIREMNYWGCTVIKEVRLFTKEAFLSTDTAFFLFKRSNTNLDLLATRGEVASVFVTENVDCFLPEQYLSLREYIPLSADDDISSIPYVGNQEIYGLICDKGEPVGVLMDIKNIYAIAYPMNMEIYHRGLMVDFYKRIIDNIEEEIFITDEYGFIQFLNPHAEKVCGVKLSEVIGWHVDDLEKKGIISSSISKEVFRRNCICNKMMELQTGETVFATGIPIYDTNGKLSYVLATSKNIKEMSDFLAHYHELTTELDKKESKINELSNLILTQGDYVIESEEMKAVLRKVLKVAPTDATVLIDGENGSGKEVITDLIFKFSNRVTGPFVKVNCAAIPENLMESEFFGYEAGAFTGAVRGGKIGTIEMANGGTLFLDEIGEMPLSLQVKLLAVLQDREIVRVGGSKRIPVNVRFVAATNRDLWSMVTNGTFRRDLYFRLNVFPIHLPPLRQRIDDIEPLSHAFLRRFNNRFDKRKVLAPSVISFFQRYSWPGNVREMMHLIERLVIACEKDIITMEDVKENLNMEDIGGMDINDSLDSAGDIFLDDSMSLKDAKYNLEISMVRKAYEKYQSSYKVAEELGISQAAVMKILKRHGYCLKNGVLVKRNSDITTNL